MLTRRRIKLHVELRAFEKRDRFHGSLLNLQRGRRGAQSHSFVMFCLMRKLEVQYNFCYEEMTKTSHLRVCQHAPEQPKGGGPVEFVSASRREAECKAMCTTVPHFSVQNEE